MKTASIYKLHLKGYILHAQSRTKSGFWIATEPFKRIPENYDSLGFLVSEIKFSLIKDDSERVPDPKNWDLFNKEMLEKMGLNSFSLLHKKTVKYCSVRLENDLLTFTPSKHAEVLSQGFLHKNEERVMVPFNAPDEEIVNSLDLAFSRCE